jgi:tRNA1Val (adenine37-N6)-methyltransferase
MEDPSATLVGVEVQEISFTLASATIKQNNLEHRVHLIRNDLRDPNLLPPGSKFDLITGSPPYLPIGKGVQSPNSQKAGARIELKGSVYEYCETARRYLAPGGIFCFVMVTTDPRTEDAPTRHGLKVIEKWDYTFKEGRNPYICTMVCMREEDVEPGMTRKYGHMLVRKKDASTTDAYEEFRLYMVGQT